MGKTVTTYLIDGDPKGTQYAFISNKICQMFVGAMIGIRNPQAHNNLLITKDNAIRELHFASMLMYKIDDELV
mgnify:CR=1 FL=1